MDVLNVNDDGETAMQTMQRPSGLTIRTRKATNRPNSCESQPCCPVLLAGTAQAQGVALFPPVKRGNTVDYHKSWADS